ncbi:MAG: hypothetical protein PVH17_09510, partial [Anaerolineae bacterium]
MDVAPIRDLFPATRRCVCQHRASVAVLPWEEVDTLARCRAERHVSGAETELPTNVHRGTHLQRR